MSRISSCLKCANHFLLFEKEALAIVEHQISVIGENWHAVCEEAELTKMDQTLLWGRQFLNPFDFNDLKAEHSTIARLASKIRATK